MEASLITTFAVTCVAFTGIWLINVATKDAGVIDYYWGPGFLVIALVHAWTHGIAHPLQWVLLVAVAVWSIRATAGRRDDQSQRPSKSDGSSARSRYR